MNRPAHFGTCSSPTNQPQRYMGRGAGGGRGSEPVPGPAVPLRWPRPWDSSTGQEAKGKLTRRASSISQGEAIRRGGPQPSTQPPRARARPPHGSRNRNGGRGPSRAVPSALASRVAYARGESESAAERGVTLSQARPIGLL